MTASHPGFCRLIGRALLAAALLGALPAQAATLFGVVTDRAAPAAVEGARQHLARHPRDRIVLRTPAQILAASCVSGSTPTRCWRCRPSATRRGA